MSYTNTIKVIQLKLRITIVFTLYTDITYNSHKYLIGTKGTLVTTKPIEYLVLYFQYKLNAFIVYEKVFIN